MNAKNERFDFVKKLFFNKDKVDHLFAGSLDKALSTVFLDLSVKECNFKCIFCDGFYRESTNLRFRWEELCKLIDELEEANVHSVLISGDGSEPLTYTYFDNLIEKLTQKNILVGLYTNGVFIDKHFESILKCTFVRISLNAGSSTTHMRLHNCSENNFKKITENIKKLILSDGPDVGISFLIYDENVLEIPSAALLSYDLGGSYFEIKPCYDRYYNAILPKQNLLKQLSQLIQEAMSYATDTFKIILNNQISFDMNSRKLTINTKTKSRPCFTNGLRLVINPHGCYPCPSYRGNEDKLIGKIQNQSIRQILTSSLRNGQIGMYCNYQCCYHDQNKFLIILKDDPFLIHKSSLLNDEENISEQYYFL